MKGGREREGEREKERERKKGGGEREKERGRKKGGKPLYPGSSTINQLDRIMSTLPPPSRQDVESIKSPYAKAILDQIIH
uniref:Uncharacterized protein n=1 Tax=Amphimedon queenslandica TaxID=400682 RepID=A0A1X7SGS0_AMPQE